MKIVFCWPTISGYMATCWKELARRPGVDLSVIAFESESEDNTAFDSGMMSDVECRLLKKSERSANKLVRDLVLQQRPDIVFLSGWNIKPYVRLGFDSSLSKVPLVMTMDNPYKYNLRQSLARFKIGSYLVRMDGVFVAGERSWQFAQRLRIPEYKIRRGMYGVDYKRLSSLLQLRLQKPAGWPRSFLFVGRYQEIKGIDLLLDAYGIYRTSIPDPWPLRCCGMGPLSRIIDTARGVENLGFLQPQDLETIQIDSGVFVLPSRNDPWPLAIVENCAAGLPILCTEACGSAVEVVRSFYNGVTIATDNVEALAKGLLWMHHHHSYLKEMGLRSSQLASPYSAEIWADRVLDTVQELVIIER